MTLPGAEEPCPACGAAHPFHRLCVPRRWGKASAAAPVVPPPPFATSRWAVGDADALRARDEADAARTGAGSGRAVCERPDCPRKPAPPRGGS